MGHGLQHQYIGDNYRWDMDSSGTLSVDEFARMCKEMVPKTQASLAQRDGVNRQTMQSRLARHRMFRSVSTCVWTRVWSFVCVHV